jgi:hypothetical protein
VRQLWRSGFGRDLVVVLLVTVVVGSLVASGLSIAADKYFTASVNHLVGDYGEYDLIVHVREENQEAFQKTFNAMLEKRIPGARVKRGPNVTGKANFFLAVSDRDKSRKTFESLGKWMSDLPGYAGQTFITEPSVVVSNVHVGVREILADELGALEGVRFVFRDGANLVAMVDNPERAEAVYKTAQELASHHAILEVRFPIEYRPTGFEQAAMDVEKALQGMWGREAVRDVSVADQSDEMDSFIIALREMKRFLLGYATQVEVRLAGDDGIRANDVLELTDRSSPKALMRVTSVTDSLARGYIESGDATSFLTTGAKRVLNDNPLRTVLHPYRFFETGAHGYPAPAGSSHLLSFVPQTIVHFLALGSLDARSRSPVARSHLHPKPAAHRKPIAMPHLCRCPPLP